METLRVAVLVLVLAVFCRADIPPKPEEDLSIVGGHEIDIRDAAYQVALLKSNDLFCGGSIISKNFILTAGHCCHSDIIDGARVGSTYYDKGGTLYGIKTYTIHPKFEMSEIMTDYDVCVMELTTSLRFSDTVRPIKIADSKPKPYEVVKVAGWGQMTESFSSLSKSLVSVEVPVTSSAYCKRAYPYIKSMDRVLCAGFGGKDSCKGDSGGGLIYREELVGVVSFGSGCARKNYPGVYASTSDPELRDFIRQVTGI